MPSTADPREHSSTDAERYAAEVKAIGLERSAELVRMAKSGGFAIPDAGTLNGGGDSITDNAAAVFADHRWLVFGNTLIRQKGSGPSAYGSTVFFADGKGSREAGLSD